MSTNPAPRNPQPLRPVIQRSGRLSIGAVDGFLDDWIAQFASRRAFLRIDGRPVLSLLNVTDFDKLYGTDGFLFLLQYIRRKLVSHFGVNPFLIGVFPLIDEYHTRILQRLPVDAVTGYGMLPDWEGPPVQWYGDLIPKRVAEWHRLQQRLNIPFLPVVCAGWDATLRGAPVADIRQVRGFPWRPIVAGVTPQLFGRFLDEAIAFNERWHPAHRVVFLHAYNEWTEASAIEPSERFGSGFLEQIHARSRQLEGAL